MPRHQMLRVEVRSHPRIFWIGSPFTKDQLYLHHQPIFRGELHPHSSSSLAAGKPLFYRKDHGDLDGDANMIVLSNECCVMSNENQVHPSRITQSSSLGPVFYMKLFTNACPCSAVKPSVCATGEPSLYDESNSS